MSLYNRYIPYGSEYRRIPGEDEESRPSRERPERDTTSRRQRERSASLSALLKAVKLEKLDAGDTLLLLIILFLFLDGEDNWELIIALGLILLLGPD